jgi:hypothetical protein
MSFGRNITASATLLIRSLLLVLMSVAAARTAWADSLTYMRIEQAVLEERVQRTPSDIADRLAILRSQFRRAGCSDPLLEQAVPGAVLPNLICTLPGAVPGVLVIAASLDYRSHGEEERVQWATLELLPLLAESLNATVHRHTLVFAAFSGHNHDFAGSSIYLQRLSSTERKNLHGIIYLDHLGRVPPAYAHSFTYKSSKALAGNQRGSYSPNVLTANTGPAAQALKLAALPEIDDIAPTDTVVFAEVGVPAINLHSLSYSTVAGPGETETHLLRSALDMHSYNDTYNLLCVYVLYVDKLLAGNHSNSQRLEPDENTNSHK